MKKVKPKLSKEERHKAAVDMISYYFQSYYSDWRYIKVLTNQKLLATKYSFYDTLTLELYGEIDEPTIAQEIKNGLYYDTIAHCIQYIEELFALIRASKEEDFFIKNIVTYQAGQVTNFIKGCKPTEVNLGEYFHFPHDLPFTKDADQIKFTASLHKLKMSVEQILKFYSEYEFFYIQYKHGLSIPMRPFGNRYTADQVQLDKEGNSDPFLAAFDNFNLSAATKRKTFKTSDGVFMPGFTENVRRVITRLHDEDNFLRFSFPPLNEGIIDFSTFVSVAQMVRICVNIFKFNFTGKVNGHSNEFQLPCNVKNNTVLTISCAKS